MFSGTSTVPGASYAAVGNLVLSGTLLLSGGSLAVGGDLTLTGTARLNDTAPSSTVIIGGNFVALSGAVIVLSAKTGQNPMIDIQGCLDLRGATIVITNLNGKPGEATNNPVNAFHYSPNVGRCPSNYGPDTITWDPIDADTSDPFNKPCRSYTPSSSFAGGVFNVNILVGPASPCPVDPGIIAGFAIAALVILIIVLAVVFTRPAVKKALKKCAASMRAKKKASEFARTAGANTTATGGYLQEVV